MIDSHCHLDHEPLFSNINEVIQRSKKAGIKKILTISTNLKSFENYSKEEIYDHRKAKFLQIGRDKGFSKSTNINDTGLTYKESGVIKLRSHFFKYKYMYVVLGFVTLIGLIYTLF